MSDDPITAIRLLEEALHIRMNGEYAPGGKENWHDWDRKAETFLRAHHARQFTEDRREMGQE